MRQSRRSKKYTILFADDCAIVSETEVGLQVILCTLFRQDVSNNKTKAMAVQRAAPRVEEDEDSSHGSDNEVEGAIEEPRVAAAAQPVSNWIAALHVKRRHLSYSTPPNVSMTNDNCKFAGKIRQE